MDYTHRVTGNNSSGVQAVVTLGGYKYDSATFSIPTGQSDVDLKLATPVEGHLFNNIKRAFFIEISSNKDISFKLNSASNDPISLLSTEFPWKNLHIEVQNIFITNSSGSTATVKILLF